MCIFMVTSVVVLVTLSCLFVPGVCELSVHRAEVRDRKFRGGRNGITRQPRTTYTAPITLSLQ